MPGPQPLLRLDDEEVPALPVAAGGRLGGQVHALFDQLAGHLAAASRSPRPSDRADRRAYAVTLTPAGRERLTAAERTVPALLDEALAPLNAQERGQLSALLLKLTAPG
ncbi:MarR family transcriptional regulator [Kitasatospora sp. NPDC059673]|uniref:MarR family transcriptional regulator n=1 Tax=Kitasatospora sp. NPDC059673 TaxID=3346901 RepID=UPI00367A6165